MIPLKVDIDYTSITNDITYFIKWTKIKSTKSFWHSKKIKIFNLWYVHIHSKQNVIYIHHLMQGLSHCNQMVVSTKLVHHINALLKVLSTISQ